MGLDTIVGFSTLALTILAFYLSRKDRRPKLNIRVDLENNLSAYSPYNAKLTIGNAGEKVTSIASIHMRVNQGIWQWSNRVGTVQLPYRLELGDAVIIELSLDSIVERLRTSGVYGDIPATFVIDDGIGYQHVSNQIVISLAYPMPLPLPNYPLPAAPYPPSLLPSWMSGRTERLSSLPLPADELPVATGPLRYIEPAALPRFGETERLSPLPSISRETGPLSYDWQSDLHNPASSDDLNTFT